MVVGLVGEGEKCEDIDGCAVQYLRHRFSVRAAVKGKCSVIPHDPPRAASSKDVHSRLVTDLPEMII